MTGIIDRGNFVARNEGDTQEITLDVAVINDSSESEDYFVEIYSESGTLLASTAPAFIYPSKTIGAGLSHTFCISSDCASLFDCATQCGDWNRGDLGNVFEVRLIHDVFGWNNPIDDRIFVNTARPNLIFNTREEALASVTDEDRANNQITGECGIICQFIKENKKAIIVGGVIIGGLLAYSLIKK